MALGGLCKSDLGSNSQCSNLADIYLLKVNNKSSQKRHQNNANGVVLVSLLFTLKMFHTLF